MNLKKIFLLSILTISGISKADEYVPLQPLNSFSSVLNYFKILFLDREWTMNNPPLDEIKAIYNSNKIIKNSMLLVAILGTFGMYKSLREEEKIQAPKTLAKWGQFLGSAAITAWSIFAFMRGHNIGESLDLTVGYIKSKKAV